MPSVISRDTAGTILLIGASRGLGLSLAAEFLTKGWNVVGTVQESARTELHDLADDHPGRVEIESLDITEPDQITALHDRLSGRSFEILFHNAGIANANPHESIAEVATEEFVRVMVTNALSPMRVIDELQDLVPADGLIGIMSSGQGSISNNEKGGGEVYRGSKAALNQFMRCYATRHAGERRALVLMAPGWIRTALGGPNAPFSVEEAIPKVVDVLLSQQGKPGLRYLDREGRTVPW
jgi:NAD(P)-dependent dehydrogenase (short-subunit alcohol dehydrogenase family)